jgi:hypothetical protein
VAAGDGISAFAASLRGVGERQRGEREKEGGEREREERKRDGEYSTPTFRLAMWPTLAGG